MNTRNSSDDGGRLSLGPLTLMPESGSLSDGSGQEIFLEPRLARLLHVLGTHANELVLRRELLERVWPDTIVNEESLTRAVSDLRKLLKSRFAHPPEIETIPKRGYKLIVPIASRDTAVWKRVLKFALYGIGGIILLVLVLRGLHY